MLNSVFSTAMRRAAELTREHKVVEATRAIQRLLTGRGGAEADQRAEATELTPQGLPERDAAGTAASLLELEQNGIKNGGADLNSTIRAKWPLSSHSEPSPQADLPNFFDGARPVVKLRRAPSPPTPNGATYVKRAFVCEAGARDYKLYIPSRSMGEKRPLLVMLHGCTQDPDDFAIGTGMNRLAEEHGFVVAYPWQVASGNHLKCWNWFDPANQGRDLGEPCIIAGITRLLAAELDLDHHRIYVAGLSAGGAMAEILSATYPDLYAAAGVHSGLPFRSAADPASAFAAMRGSQRPRGSKIRPRRRARTIVFHGTSDSKVHPSNGEIIVAEACAGCENGLRKLQQSGSAGGRAYTRTMLVDARGIPHVEHWVVQGLGHAWSGGDPGGSHTDRRGPEASREILRFFFATAEQPAGIGV